MRTCEISAIPSYHSVWGPKPVTTLPYLADGAKRDRLVWSGDLWWAQRSFFVGFKPSAPYLKGSVEMLAANHTPEGYVQGEVVNGEGVIPEEGVESAEIIFTNAYITAALEKALAEDGLSLPPAKTDLEAGTSASPES